jgi:hypothetical protein
MLDEVASTSWTPTWGITMTWQEPQDDPEWRGAYGDYGHEPHTGQYGQAPHAQDPWGQAGYAQGPYAQDPYAQGPYAQDPYGQYNYSAYGPPGGLRPASTGVTIAALVANIVTALVCCVGIAWIPGIILSAIALSRANTDPESTRRLTVGAWVCFAVNILLAVAVVVVFGIVGASNDTSGP